METREWSAVAPKRDAWTPQAVLNLGRPLFHAMLLCGLHDMVGVDHLSHLRYDSAGRIAYARCASLLDQPMIEGTTHAYVDRLYRHDPNYERVCDAARHPASNVQMVAVLPKHIRDAEYREQLFEKPGFTSKISMLGTWGGNTCYINLYFSCAVSSRAAALLRQCAPLVISLAQRHDELGSAQPVPEAAPFPGFDRLSVRERQVAELLWLGHTAKEAARALKLSPATVLTYKARLFEKAKVGNLKAFLLKAPSQA